MNTMIDRPDENVLYETNGPTAYVTLNRPDRMNAMSFEMRRGVGRWIREADEDDDVRTIVVTGAGDAFCSGMDLESLSPDVVETILDPDAPDDMMLRSGDVTTPIIAAVNGHCIAAGFEFLLATDLRIASEDALFGLREPRWGMVAASGSHTRLQRQIPHCHAMEYLLTGELHPAEHALHAGLVNDIVSEGDVLERAEDLADSIAKNGPSAIATTKRILQEARSLDQNEAFRAEAESGATAIHSNEAEEGMMAYREDRDPSFSR